MGEKEHQVRFRVDEEQWQDLSHVAKSHGLTVTGFCKFAAMERVRVIKSQEAQSNMLSLIQGFEGNLMGEIGSLSNTANKQQTTETEE